MEIPRIRIVSVDRHKNKLKTGHLRGNRFIIKLRDTEPERVDEVRAQLALLHEKGIPNYFGPQRFGLRGDTGLIGQALLLGNPAEAASLIAGRPGEQDSGDVAEARRLYDDGRFAEAADTWPRGFMECVRLCRAMAKTHGNARSALRSLGRRTIDFYLSAWQSMLFNDVVGARIDSLDRVRDGDLAWKHVNGAVFGVEGSDSEQPRADRFEISPTGPIFGRKMKRPRGAPAAIEAQVLSERDISPDDFQQRGWLSCTGVRRPLRFRPEDARATMGSDEHGAYIELGFTIQPGCYATTLLREICKDRLVDVADAQPTMLS